MWRPPLALLATAALAACGQDIAPRPPGDAATSDNVAEPRSNARVIMLDCDGIDDNYELSLVGGACPDRYDCATSQCTCAFGYDRCGAQCAKRCSESSAVCADLSSSWSDCGACGRRCPEAATCVRGVCRCPAPDSEACDGACVNVLQVREHCGACDAACGPMHACVEGVCRASLAAPAAGERVGNRRPQFRWSRGRGTVQVCEDRGCASVAAQFDGAAATGATPAAPLRPGVWFWRLRPEGVTDAQAGPAQPFRIDARDSPRPARLPPALDLDADGLADLAALDARGRVAIFRGRAAGLDANPDHVVALSSWPHHASLRAAGDADGDGLADLVAVNSYTWLVSGGPVPAHRREMRLVVSSYVPLPDVDRDGVPDWATTRAAGNVLVRGWFHDRLVTTQADEPSFRAEVNLDPRTVAPVGNVNGDGFLDVVFGAPRVGRAYLYLGSSAGFDRSSLVPPAPRATSYGAWVAPAGDVNGDGFADALVGLGDAGAAVYLGSADGLAYHRTLVNAAGDDVLVATAGDADGDGCSDLAAVPRARGELWLYRGSPEGLAATPLVSTDARWATVETLGCGDDLDGDGRDDLCLGAPSRDSVHVLYGAAALPTTRVTTLRGEIGSEFGTSLR